MFDIAWSELFLIAVVALIFIGPKELPAVLQNLGRLSAKLRRSADDFRRQFEDSMKEAGYEDLHKNIQDFRSLNPASQLKESIDRAVNQSYALKSAIPAEPPPRPDTSMQNLEKESGPAQLSNSADDVLKGIADQPVERGGEAEPGPLAAPAGEKVKDHVAPVA